MYRQKSVIFTIGKTLYIYIGWAKYKRKKRVFSIYIRKNTNNNAYVKEISYMGLYKSSLPNLNYCYIKRAAGFCHQLLPLDLATWFSHPGFCHLIQPLDLATQPLSLTIFTYIAAIFNSDMYREIPLIYSFSLLFYLYFLITFSSPIYNHILSLSIGFSLYLLQLY